MNNQFKINLNKMKNIISAVTFISSAIISLFLRKYYLNVFKITNKEQKLLTNTNKDFDKCLRNFHPNKGE